MMRKQLYIGELAQLVGVTPKTVRHYHKIGLLPKPFRAPNGYRLYDTNHLRQLQRIRRLRGLGMSLNHIRCVLIDAHPNAALRSMLETHLDKIKSQLRELEEQRDLITGILAEPDIHIDFSSEGESFYLEQARTQFAELLPTLDEQLLLQETAVDTLLGSLKWPAIDEANMDALEVTLEKHSESIQQLIIQHAQIWTQLKALSPESPEIPRMAAEFVQKNHLILQLFQQPGARDSEGNAITAVFSEMVNDILTPTQQCFMEQVMVEWAQLGKDAKDETKG